MLHLMNSLYILMVLFIMENWYLTPCTSHIWQAIPKALKRGQAIRHAVSTPQFPMAAHFLALSLPPLTYASLSPLDHLSCTSQYCHLIAFTCSIPAAFCQEVAQLLEAFLLQRFLVAWGIKTLLESFLHPSKHSGSRQWTKISPVISPY